MCRPGTVDCTTGRAYPAFCKPLCGGPCDPFMWLAGDCDTCCCCLYEDAFTPYGGYTVCGEKMTFAPSCVAPPLRWSPPAMPMPPGGHVVHLPEPRPPLSPKAGRSASEPSKAPPAPVDKDAPTAPAPEPPAEDVPPDEWEMPKRVGEEPEPAAARREPRILYDARNDQRQPSRR
jgi:hypothetical protein